MSTTRKNAPGKAQPAAALRTHTESVQAAGTGAPLAREYAVGAIPAEVDELLILPAKLGFLIYDGLDEGASQALPEGALVAVATPVALAAVATPVALAALVCSWAEAKKARDAKRDAAGNTLA